MSPSKTVTCLCFVALCLAPLNAAFETAVQRGMGGSLAMEDKWQGSRKMMMVQEVHARMLKQECEGDNCKESPASAPALIDDDMTEVSSKPAPAPKTEPIPSFVMELLKEASVASVPAVSPSESSIDEAEPSKAPAVSPKDKAAELSVPAVSPSESSIDEAEPSKAPAVSPKDKAAELSVPAVSPSDSPVDKAEPNTAPVVSPVVDEDPVASLESSLDAVASAPGADADPSF